MENKTSKYFKYAIGEIILVVIGILIALQINNWNQNRIDRGKEKAILKNLHNDLATDSIQFAYYNSQYQQIEALHIQLYRIGIKNENLDSIGEASLIRRSLYFKQLIGGNFNEEVYPISNTEIRRKLIDYTKAMYDMEAVYNIELLPLLSDRLRPYLSEHHLYNTENWFELKKRTFEDYSFDAVKGKNLVDQEGLIALSKTKDFQQILFELNVKWNDFYSRLSTVTNKNNELKEAIQLALNENYD